MSYISTRGGGVVSAPEAILRGIAPDGGLYVPLSLPVLSSERLLALARGSYPECVAETLALLLDGYSYDELLPMARAAYAGFDDRRVVPLVPLAGDRQVLELYHGPTLAFKDMALQMLPHLMAAAARKRGETREIAILTATSGDTGKAALEAFRDAPGTSVTVFYPEHGVGVLQEMQMKTSPGRNVRVFAVRGNFDDAQTGVKRLFGDKAFNDQMNASGRVLSSANSINLGRLAPQVAYYLYACAHMLLCGAANAETGIAVAVPTGNFGNILAAWYARRMGAPIRKLICASNRNHVLTDFIRTGVYDRNRDFHRTLSPSMDILIASNLERFLYEIAGGAPTLNEWMDGLKTSGRYDIGQDRRERLQSVFYGGYADDERTADTIRETFDRENYLLDPHTAVAAAVAEDYRRETGDARPLLIAATASPFKFAPDVARALGAETGDPFMAADALSCLTGRPCPPALAELQALPVLHRSVCDQADMGRAALGEKMIGR